MIINSKRNYKDKEVVLDLSSNRNMVITNCSLGKIKKNGVWILRKDGIIDFTENNNIWILYNPYVSFGKLEYNEIEDKLYIHINNEQVISESCIRNNLELSSSIKFEFIFSKKKVTKYKNFNKLKSPRFLKKKNKKIREVHSYDDLVKQGENNKQFNKIRRTYSLSQISN